MAYIKMQDVMKICEDYSRHCFISNDSRGQNIADRILDDVIALPIVDVAKVKRGEWIYFRDSNGFKRCKCSECLTSYGCIDTPYCPNCGAIMDGGSENEETI